MINPTQLLNEGVFFVATKGYDLPNWFYRVEAFNQEMRIISLSTLFSEETHFVPMEKISLLHFAPGYQKLKERQEYDRVDEFKKNQMFDWRDWSAVENFRVAIANHLAAGKLDEFMAKTNMEKLRLNEESKARFEAFVNQKNVTPKMKWWEFWK